MLALLRICRRDSGNVICAITWHYEFAGPRGISHLTTANAATSSDDCFTITDTDNAGRASRANASTSFVYQTATQNICSPRANPGAYDHHLLRLERFNYSCLYLAFSHLRNHAA